MISLQDGIKYAGLTAIIYFLIKAFADDKIDDNKIGILVLFIVALVFLLVHNRSKCPKERYQITEPPVVDSIYPQKDNEDHPMGKPNKYENTEYIDPDIEDFKDIMGIDKQTYEKLIENEQNAIDKLIAKYKNDMIYTKSHPFNTVPLGTQLYGYTYLPPENWFRAYERPPVCVADKQCPVCPVSNGKTSDLMEFDTTRNLSGPETIDMRYEYIRKLINKNKNKNKE